ncbi:hypothetical protein BU25DRAFT_133409 [Macroventuria anomochaeta]|uniref:Uncharacterized protein n=1 Tax=Macroventuria anomochaeta TaxID=301207 RepID=A0ACB6RSP2_9PLEO|nr:uncharacterized protein BU25DRAFT_133409 [Macroventuria anomochaeta]KAF2624748.1 hypothetical protein BU25DRAFT_133409 [Macroventuria anomochaeta]
MSSADRRFPTSSARLRTLHSRQSDKSPCRRAPGVRSKTAKGPRLTQPQPCSALTVVRYPSLRCLCAAPLFPLFPVERLFCAVLLLSFILARIVPCRRRSFQMKLACWLLYVTPTTPFSIVTSCQLAECSQLCD